MGKGGGTIEYNKPTTEQILDQLPIDEVIQYVVMNYYDQTKEAIQEQGSGY